MLLNRVFKDPSTGKRYRVVLEQLSDLMLIDVGFYPVSTDGFKTADNFRS